MPRKEESPVKTKPKFAVGQVVAECYDFRDGKGEFIKGYEQLTETTVQLCAPIELDYGLRYWRPLTRKEIGPRTKARKTR